MQGNSSPRVALNVPLTVMGLAAGMLRAPYRPPVRATPAG